MLILINEISRAHRDLLRHRNLHNPRLRRRSPRTKNPRLYDEFHFWNSYVFIIIIVSCSIIALGTVGLNKSDESFERSIAFVFNDIRILSLGEELDRWEALDIDTFEFVGGSVGLGNNNVVSIGKVLSKLLVSWLERFAVSAPWRVEFNEDVFGWVSDSLFEVLADNYENWTIVGLGNIFRHQMSSNFTAFNTVDESCQRGSGDLLAWWLEFGHGVAHLDETDGWAVFLSEAEKFENSAVVFNVAINNDKESFALNNLITRIFLNDYFSP